MFAPTQQIAEIVLAGIKRGHAHTPLMMSSTPVITL
jgi:hypothetical protein